jgi:hypothetical protein
MSKSIKKTLDPNDPWCGIKFSESQKIILTELTLNQFKKPMHKRLKPWELVEIVKIKI